MPAAAIAQNLDYINWTVLTGLAVGSFGAGALSRFRNAATMGFLTFTMLCTIDFALLALPDSA